MKKTQQWSKVAVALTLGLVSGCATLIGPTSLQTDSLDTLRAQFATGSKRILVELYPSDKTQLTKMAEAGMDIWEARKGYAKGLVSQEQVKTLDQLKLKFKRLPEEQSRGFDSNYRTYDKMAAEIKDLAAKYPNICQLKDIGDSWEKTQKIADRDIWALKIGTGDTAKKPACLFVGNHHAREIVTMEVVANMAKYLCEQYGKDAEITSYVDNREIWLVPTANPDGHVRAEKGQMWRKNTNTSYGAIGVDLNRNYGYRWGGVGSSGSPSSDTYRGPKAFSEPETQALRDLMLSRKFVFHLTFHSYGNLVMWPWNSSNDPPADNRLAVIGKKMAEPARYTPEQGNELYLTTGDDTDWAYGERGILSYCIEIGREFMPSSSMLTKHWDETRPMMLTALKLADNPSRAFGPEVQVSATRGTLQAELPIGTKKVEYFLDRPGTDGTGTSTSVRSNSVQLAVQAAGHRLAYFHAQDQNGQWGPYQAVWTR